MANILKIVYYTLLFTALAINSCECKQSEKHKANPKEAAEPQPEPKEVEKNVPKPKETKKQGPEPIESEKREHESGPIEVENNETELINPEKQEPTPKESKENEPEPEQAEKQALEVNVNKNNNSNNVKLMVNMDTEKPGPALIQSEKKGHELREAEQTSPEGNATKNININNNNNNVELKVHVEPGLVDVYKQLSELEAQLHSTTTEKINYLELIPGVSFAKTVVRVAKVIFYWFKSLF